VRAIYLLAMLGVLFASLGVSYSMWSSSLHVNTYVHTGEVAVAFDGHNCSDTGADPQGGTNLGGTFTNTEGKNVATCSVTPEQTDEAGNVIKLNVTLTNAYPGYEVCVDFNVTNIGTVPVKLLQHNYTTTLSNDLYVNLIVPQDTQIEPGQNSPYTLCIGVKQSAAQNSSYSFDLGLYFAQWNEVGGGQ